MRLKLPALRERIPKPVRRAWDAVGWVEDHVSRIVLIIAALGLVVTGGAVVVGFASQASALATYLSAVAVAVLCVWGAAGIGVLMRGANATSPSATPAPPPVATARAAEAPPKPADAPEAARLNIAPIIVDGEARLRIENEGPITNMAIRLERIGDHVASSVPFRMKWHDSSEEQFSFGAPRPPESTQKILAIGGLGFVVVARTAMGERKLRIPMPGGQMLDVPRPASGELEFEISILTKPPLADSKRARRTYVLEVDGHAKITDFTLKAIPQSKS